MTETLDNELQATDDGQTKYGITFKTFLKILNSVPGLIVADGEVWHGPKYMGTLLDEDLDAYLHWEKS